MTEIIYSQRLGAISEAQFQAALDRFDLGRFVRAEPIPYGLFGQNVFLTSTAGEFVLRGAPHFDWQFPTEAFHAQFLHDHAHVPTPLPYRVDPATDIFGWSYVIMPRMPGLQLADPQVWAGLSADDHMALARMLGETLALIQKATYPSPGRYQAARQRVEPFDLAQEMAWPLPPDWFPSLLDIPPTPIPFSERVKAVLRWHFEQARIANPAATSAADLEWIEEIIADAQTALNDSFEPTLVLEDYKPQNLVVSRTTQGWHVTGLFDLMQAYFGDGEADLARQYAAYLDEPEGEPLAREFLNGYLRLHPPRPGFEQRFAVYILLDRSLFWDYFQTHDAEWRATRPSLRDWASRYLAPETR